MSNRVDMIGMQAKLMRFHHHGKVRHQQIRHGEPWTAPTRAIAELVAAAGLATEEVSKPC